MKRIQLNTILSLVIIISTFMGQAVVPASSFACGGATSGSAKSYVLGGVGESGVNCNSKGVTNLVGNIVTIISVIAGIIGVIMIIVSGLKFMTAGGDTQKVNSAKNTLLYAIIGLAVAALALAIVHFVLNQSTSVLSS